MKAVIFDIQRFALNDGPGVRTIIFFKGCPLRCVWCHNPESLNPYRDYMYFVNKCVGCQACAAVCGQGVHSFADGVHQVRYERCIRCGKCLEVCCYEALSIIGREYTVEEVLKEVETDRAYYGEDGGVTLSGGEPMMQAEFVTELAKRLKARGINVCMETSGYAKTSLFQKAAPAIDLFLFDYKVTSQERHKELTGVSNNLILQNLNYLNQAGKKIILRCPLIPGINDTDEHFRAIADLAAEYKMIQTVDILPYHGMGEMKRRQLGMTNNLEDKSNATLKQKQLWLKKLQEFGCNAQIS